MLPDVNLLLEAAAFTPARRELEQVWADANMNTLGKLATTALIGGLVVSPFDIPISKAGDAMESFTRRSAQNLDTVSVYRLNPNRPNDPVYGMLIGAADNAPPNTLRGRKPEWLGGISSFEAYENWIKISMRDTYRVTVDFPHTDVETFKSLLSDGIPPTAMERDYPLINAEAAVTLARGSNVKQFSGFG